MKPRRITMVLPPLAFLAEPAPAQELTPRLYAPSPTGANVFTLGCGRSKGAVLSDPVPPFDDVQSHRADRRELRLVGGELPDGLVRAAVRRRNLPGRSGVQRS